MPKKAKNSKKLGRPELLGTKKLLDRYKALKRFLEDNWGRIGLELQRVRHPDDVKAILKRVPGVEWCTPFRDHRAICLLEEGATKVGRNELGRTRQKDEDADATETRLWSEYHNNRRKAEEATTALKAVISQFEAAIALFPFFLVIFLVAHELSVEHLTNNSNRLEESLRLAQKEKQMLKERLSSQEAWSARNEVVKFARSGRYRWTPANFAKAMAGLPEYGWLRSFRKCPAVPDESLFSTTYNYQLFQLLESILKKVQPLSLGKIEVMLRSELLRQDADPLLRAYVAPNWAYMRQALAECKGFKRAEAPYTIMGSFLDNVERSKTIAELELAKREQLV